MPIAIAQGYFFARITRWRHWFKYFFYLLYIFLIINMFSVIGEKLFFRHQYALYPEFARWISTQTEPNAVIIVADERFFISHYGQRETLSRPVQIKNIIEKKAMSLFKNQLDNLLENGRPVYITTPGLISYDKYNEFVYFFDQNYILEYRGSKNCEDWHRGVLNMGLFLFDLYRVKKI